MNEESVKPGPGNEPAGDSARKKGTVEWGFCPLCNYDMKGLVAQGNCPECGCSYAEDSLMPRPLPGTLLISLRFLWPMAVLIIFSIIYISENQGSDYLALGWMSMCMYVLGISILNGLVQVFFLFHRQNPQDFRRGTLMHRLGRIGTLAIVLIAFTVVLPSIIVAGCLGCLVAFG